MKQPKSWAELYQQFEDDEIDRAIATLERIRMERKNMFVLIEASKLSLNDAFMMHVPKTQRQAEFKIALIHGITKGYKDFWKPKIDPSFNANQDGIRYEIGQRPAVGKGYKWWKKAAKEFWPERKSRLGTQNEYIAFLGVLIKKLVEAANWKIDEAWYAVCDDSEKLGVYWNDLGAEFGLSNTGEFEICGFGDLANTYKMVDSTDLMEGFFYAGGSCQCSGLTYPLAHIGKCALMVYMLECTVGWVILEEDCA